MYTYVNTILKYLTLIIVYEEIFIESKKNIINIEAFKFFSQT